MKKEKNRDNIQMKLSYYQKKTRSRKASSILGHVGYIWHNWTLLGVDICERKFNDKDFSPKVSKKRVLNFIILFPEGA